MSYKSQVSLASTHPNLRFLMPKEQFVEGEDFFNPGLGIRSIFDNEDHFYPETYMDVPILTRGLISVKMSFKWHDQVCCHFLTGNQLNNNSEIGFQGWGTQKGQMWLQLIRFSKVIADSR